MQLQFSFRQDAEFVGFRIPTNPGTFNEDCSMNELENGLDADDAVGEAADEKSRGEHFFDFRGYVAYGLRKYWRHLNSTF